MNQITRQTDSGVEWLVETPFERVATLVTYLENYADCDTWHAGNIAGLNYDSVWATDEAVAAAVAAYEDVEYDEREPAIEDDHEFIRWGGA